MALKKSTQNHPSKKIPETDEIFKNLKEVNARADSSADEIRISFDAKASVKIGNLSRGGKNRVDTYTYDHDFDVVASVKARSSTRSAWTVATHRATSANEKQQTDNFIETSVLD